MVRAKNRAFQAQLQSEKREKPKSIVGTQLVEDLTVSTIFTLSQLANDSSKALNKNVNRDSFNQDILDN